MADSDFELGAGFEGTEASSNVRLGKFEAMYEEIFAEVIEDGVITSEERARLDRAAESLGLDRSRLRRLEQALQAAFETHHRTRVRDETARAAPRPALEPLEPVTDQRTLALERRIKELEGRVAELELELQEARAQMAVEIDLSDCAKVAPAVPEEDPGDLLRRVRHFPRDVDSLHSLFRLYTRQNAADRRYAIGQVLTYLGVATDDEQAAFDAGRPRGLVRPSAALSRESWGRLLFHPELEMLVGEILSTVASAVLLGRVSVLRREKALPKLDPKKRVDPAKDAGVLAIKSLTWAGRILGLSLPPLYADPDANCALEMVPGMPPSTRLGQHILSGRTAGEVAFLAGQHLTYYRDDFFVHFLFPSVADVEDVFLSALSIGNPGLPLNAAAKARVMPLAQAIEPILDPAAVDRLRGHFLRFLEQGGRTNLQRWAVAVDHTATRAGMLLCGDLRVADTVLRAVDPVHAEARVDDLIEFVASDRYTHLRRHIGIALD